MSLAEEYCNHRAANLTKPCSWQKSYWEGIEADDIDTIYLHNAQFLDNGTTIIFEDGSKAFKSLNQRRNPWIVAV